MGFNDNNNVIFENDVKVNDVTNIKFTMLENKRSGVMRASIREFKCTATYDGPTKNGMMFAINNIEDVSKMQKNFNDFFEKIKSML
jgi:hypothetical protein